MSGKGSKYKVVSDHQVDDRFVLSFEKAPIEEWWRCFQSPLGNDFDLFLRQKAASEGTIWLFCVNSKVLRPIINNGGHGEAFFGHAQPVEKGMIGMVFQTEMPICENKVYHNRNQDPMLDRKLGLRTCSMAAVPLSFFGRIRGVVTAIRSRSANQEAPDPPDFEPPILVDMQRVARLWGRQMELSWIQKFDEAGTHDRG